jgi:hypothetical protein
VQAGIKRVVSCKSDNDRWAESFAFTTEIFNEAGVELVMLENEPAPQAGPRT